MSEGVLKPGEIIKPCLDQAQAEELLTRLYGLTASSVKEFNSYDDRNFFFRVRETGASIWPHGYILKVTNSRDSGNLLFSDAQNQMILHLAGAGLEVPQPVPNLSGQLQSLETVGATRNIVRLLRFIPGKTLYEVDTWTKEHFFQCGEFVARMDLSLQTFKHPGYENRNSIWYLSSIPDVKDFTFAITDPERRRLAEEIIQEFSDTVKPVESQLEKAIIHGDFNEQNILCRESPEGSGQYSIHSVIDFGDSNYNPLVYELAITMMYMMTRCSTMSPSLAGGHVIAGYIRHRQLSALERRLIRICVASRYAQSLVMGAYSYSQDPGNDYLLITSKTGWDILTSFWSTPLEALYADWDEIIKSYHSSETNYLTSAL